MAAAAGTSPRRQPCGADPEADPELAVRQDPGTRPAGGTRAADRRWSNLHLRFGADRSVVRWQRRGGAGANPLVMAGGGRTPSAERNIAATDSSTSLGAGDGTPRVLYLGSSLAAMDLTADAGGSIATDGNWPVTAHRLDARLQESAKGRSAALKRRGQLHLCCFYWVRPKAMLEFFAPIFPQGDVVNAAS